MALDLNITLQSKDSPTVNLTVSDDAQGIILGSSSSVPLITSVATGAQGVQGVPGTAEIEDESIISSYLEDGCVTEAKIFNNAITSSKINSSAVTSSKVAINAITTSKILDNAITAAKIAPGAITLELIDIFADGAIEPDKLKPGSLVEANFANASITAQKIANSAITAIKVQDRTLTGSKIEQNVVLDGAKINGTFQLLGNSPAYLLGPTEDDLYIQSEAGLVFRIDSDNDSTNNFLFKNGAGTTIFTLDESGNAVFTGNISTTGNMTISGTVDGVDVSSLPTSDTNTQLPLLDEDNMASNSSSSVPSQQSVKAYVDSKTHLELGTSGTTALAGDTTIISSGQASAITANTAKVDLTVDGAGTVHSNNYTNTTYSVGDGELTQRNFTSVLKTKLDGIESSADVTDATNVTSAGALMDSELTDLAGVKGVTISTLQIRPSEGAFVNGDKTKLNGIASSATAYADADAVSAVSTADDYLKNDASDTIAGDLTVDSDFLYIKDQSGSGAASRLTTATLTGNQTATLPDASGTLALTNSQKHFINFGVNLAYTYARYIPIGSYYIYEQNTDANPEYTTYVAPYDGKFIKALVRSEESLASTTLTIYKVGDGTEEPDQGSVVDTKSVDIASANTSYTFTFDSDATFSKGDAISIKIQPTTDPVAAGVVGTFVLQFDLTT